MEKASATYSNFGISLVGPIPWGTHLCQFYESQQDLTDILVPYFAEGLQNNEFCMWVTSPPLEVAEAKLSLAKAVPNIDLFINKGQIEIISYKEWYLLGGKFDANRVLQGCARDSKKENATSSLFLKGNFPLCLNENEISPSHEHKRPTELKRNVRHRNSCSFHQRKEKR